MNKQQLEQNQKDSELLNSLFIDAMDCDDDAERKMIIESMKAIRIRQKLEAAQ